MTLTFHWRKIEDCAIGDPNSTPLLISYLLEAWGLNLIFLFFRVYGGLALITKHFHTGVFTHLGFRVGRFSDLQSLTLQRLRAFGDSAVFLMEASVDLFLIFTVGNDEK